MNLNRTQLAALGHLRDKGALPHSGYWRPLWAMEYEELDGRTFASLVKRGLATRIEAMDRRSAYQLTVEGLRTVERESCSPHPDAVLQPDYIPHA